MQDFQIQQTCLPEELATILLVTMTFIIGQDFRRVFPKWIGEILCFSIRNQETKALTPKGKYAYAYLRGKYF